jgi:hypothetical protein
MKNKKIPTSTGTIVLVIIAMTVFGVVWKYEKNQQNIQQPLVMIDAKKLAVSQQAQSQQSFLGDQANNATNNKSKNIEWKTFTNDQFKFEIQYPSSFVYEEHLANTPGEVIQPDVEYILNLGSSAEGSSSSNIVGNNFLMYIVNSKNSLDDYIKNIKLTSGAVENSFEFVGTSKVGGLTSRIAKTCDMGGNCNKDVFFTDGKHIYFIRLSQYSTLKNASDKEIFDHILSSLKFIK